MKVCILESQLDISGELAIDSVTLIINIIRPVGTYPRRQAPRDEASSSIN